MSEKAIPTALPRGINNMIIYDRLWELLKSKNVSQYRLHKSGISHSTLTRLKRNQYVNTETIDKLCDILDCKVEDIMEFVPGEVSQ